MRVIHPMRLMQSVSRRIQVYQGGAEVSLRRERKKLSALFLQKIGCILGAKNVLMVHYGFW